MENQNTISESEMSRLNMTALDKKEPPSKPVTETVKAEYDDSNLVKNPPIHYFPPVDTP